MDGLAQQSVMQRTQPMRDLNQIVAMLKQGIRPAELVEQGIPPELIEEAMRMIQAEMQQQPEGLAGMSVKGRV